MIDHHTIAMANIMADAIDKFRKKHGKSPAIRLQEIKDFQSAEGTLAVDGLYGINTYTAAQHYLPARTLPMPVPALSKGAVTWKKPAPTKPAPKPEPAKPAPKPAKPITVTSPALTSVPKPPPPPPVEVDEEDEEDEEDEPGAITPPLVQAISPAPTVKEPPILTVTAPRVEMPAPPPPPKPVPVFAPEVEAEEEEETDEIEFEPPPPPRRPVAVADAPRPQQKPYQVVEVTSPKVVEVPEPVEASIVPTPKKSGGSPALFIGLMGATAYLAWKYGKRLR